MLAFAPSYPHGPFRFIRREYLIITYETDPDAIHAALPEPLEPAAGSLAFYERMKMPDPRVSAIVRRAAREQRR
jgi:acetoacetate decarboxylase